MAFFMVTLLSVLSLANAEVFLVRRQLENDSNNVELSCYFNGAQSESTGLGWVLPSATKIIPQVNERWRHTSRSGLIKGHFEYYGHIWKSATSLTVEPPNWLPPVLDERWNEFSEIRTSGGVEFSRAIEFRTDRFYVSVLAKSDAHIALSVASNPYSSHTYWIALDQHSISGSAIRRCAHGLPRSLLPRFSDCKAIRAGHKGIDMLNGGSEWVHLKIETSVTRSARTLKVSVVSTDDSEGGSHTISSMSWTDPNALANVRYMSFRTQDTPGLWRVHDYRVVLHNGRADGEGFNVFQLSEPHQCCLQLYFYFKPSYGTAVVNSKDKNQTIVLQPKEGVWQTLRVNMNMKPPSDHVHILPPTNLSSDIKRGSVFAISQPFRICGDEEFFVSKITAEAEQLENAKCTSLKTAKSASLQKDLDVAKISGTDCPENKFSKSCNISCGRVVGDFTCRGKVLCDDTGCSCLSGYRPTTLWNTTCQEKIPTDIANPPTAKPTEDDGETVAEFEELDESSGESADYDLEDAETAQRADESRPVCDGGNNAAVIILSIIIVVMATLAVLGVWYWRSKIWPNSTPFDVRWRQSRTFQNQLIHTEMQDD